MKALLRLALFVVGVFAFFMLGFAWRDIQSGSVPTTNAMTTLLGIGPSGREVSPAQLFRQTYDKILHDYAKDVDAQRLKYAGIEGLLGSLGDPHTVFLEPKAAQEFQLETRANFVGVGARLSPDPLGAKVVVVFEDGPAFRAGLKAGDTITKVDDTTVVGMPIDEIVKMIRGEPRTQVRLQVLRTGSDGPVTITATRARITTPTVEARVLPDTRIGYLSISAFAEPTAKQFDQALDKFEQERVEGLVLDVRGNPGGLLESSVELLSRFVENKVVVKMRGRDGREEVARTYSGMARNFRYPIVVLINEESASAAEIFAGGLRDYKIATLVGEHTYGKASVQNVRMLRDQSSAKITIARYFLPNGEDISRKVDEDGQYVSGGLQPEVKVELDLDTVVTIGDPESDSQLQKALEIIRAKR